jgi:hypothetical protein
MFESLQLGLAKLGAGFCLDIFNGYPKDPAQADACRAILRATTLRQVKAIVAAEDARIAARIDAYTTGG